MLVGFLIVAAFVILTLFAVDRHFCLKDAERDLKEFLGDLEVARDLSSDAARVHYTATVSATKALIRRNFKL